MPRLLERIPKYVIGTSQDAHTAYCPACRWIAVYPTMSEAAAGGLEHYEQCIRA